MLKEFQTTSFWRALVAEFLGMTVFVFLGTGSATAWGGPDTPPDLVQISLTFGLAIATLAQCVGHVSGAHLNPAVTIGLLVGCQISLPRALLYVVAQMLGAVAASGILYGVTPLSANSTLGANALGKDVTPGQGLGVEIIVTFQLVLCVFATTDKRRTDISGSAPLAIGISVVIGHLLAIGFTGCGMNPARSFGPAVVGGLFQDHWVYWVGPLIGGIAAALVYDFILAPRLNLTKRLKVLTNGQMEDYDMEGNLEKARVEMKPK